MFYLFSLNVDLWLTWLFDIDSAVPSYVRKLHLAIIVPHVSLNEGATRWSVNILCERNISRLDSQLTPWNYHLSCYWFKVILSCSIGSFKYLQQYKILVCPHMAATSLAENISIQYLFLNIKFDIKITFLFSLKHIKHN